jgi:glutamine---fructose-6-phosphate transaminase (isomerizing)
MCGIFGYIGSKEDAAEQTLEGLKTLEYRGYDSWGITVKDHEKLAIEKHVGKIGDANVHLPKSTLGIGHTRWATHGGVTEKNAHPHLDCTKKIAVLHNGIIENFSDIKKVLLEKNHKFVSETDTEVVTHLIEDCLRDKESISPDDFKNAVRTTFSMLKGLNAIVVAYAPLDMIVAAKTGSPLVLGRNNEGFYVASDITGIIKHTREIFFLKDQEMAVLGSDIKIFSLTNGKEISAKFEVIDWKIEEVTKGKFKHFLLKEIHEQPIVLDNIALNYDIETQKLADKIHKAFGTFMLGCGTASYAALTGTYLFSRVAKKHVNFSIASEFNYLEDYLTPDSLVIAISQSGETIDVVSSIESAKKKGSKIAALVNVLGSTLYRQADMKVLLGAGPEKAVVSTKAFIAMVAVQLLTAYTLAKRQKEAKDLLLKASKNVSDILTDKYKKDIESLAQKIKKKEHIYVIGRGMSYAASLEAALKMKETCYIHAEGFAGGELKHGVIALIEKDTPCIVFAPKDETYDEIISNAQEIKARGGFIIGIGPENNGVFDRFLPTADVGDATIIPQTVIAQLIAYHLALAKNIKDPDKPRNLAKSVTVK